MKGREQTERKKGGGGVFPKEYKKTKDQDIISSDCRILSIFSLKAKWEHITTQANTTISYFTRLSMLSHQNALEVTFYL